MRWRGSARCRSSSLCSPPSRLPRRQAMPGATWTFCWSCSTSYRSGARLGTAICRHTLLSLISKSHDAQVGLAILLESPLLKVIDKLRGGKKQKEEKPASMGKFRARAVAAERLRAKGGAGFTRHSSAAPPDAAMVMPEKRPSRGTVTLDAVALQIHSAEVTPRDKPKPTATMIEAIGDAVPAMPKGRKFSANPPPGMPDLRDDPKERKFSAPPAGLPP